MLFTLQSESWPLNKKMIHCQIFLTLQTPLYHVAKHDFWLIVPDNMFISTISKHEVISLWQMCLQWSHKESKFNSFYKYLPEEWVPLITCYWLCPGWYSIIKVSSKVCHLIFLICSPYHHISFTGITRELLQFS